MAVQVSYPGVYIDEFQPASPIQGASTSVAAFLGANAFGPPNKPTLITSFDEYRQLYALPAPTPPEDDDYLWYAVRGFFENGGQTCYVTAVTNASAGRVDLNDEASTPQPSVRITARRLGAINPTLQVQSVESHVVTAARVYVVEAAVTADALTGANVIPVANPGRFLAGDELQIFITGAQARQQLVTVAYTDAAGVHIRTPLLLDYPLNLSPSLRFAPLTAGTRSLRVESTAATAGADGLVVGSIVTFAQPAAGGGQVAPHTTVLTSVRAERVSANLTTYRIELRDPLGTGFSLDTTRRITLQSEEFTLSVLQAGAPTRNYANLSMSATHPNYYAAIINADPAGAVLAEPFLASNGAPNQTALPDNRPIQTTPRDIPAGTSHSAAALTGGVQYVDALSALAPIKDVSIVAIPDRTDATVQSALLAHCSNLWDRVAIFDPQPGADLSAIQVQQSSLQDTNGFGALYYPRIEVASVKTGRRMLIPPSGHIAGIYARTDLRRGVFKAPAGNEAAINGALGVERALTDAQQGIINLKGVNVIRVFATGGRPIVWGARTTSTDTNWQYVNIRRLFLFLEESIQTGIRGAVFEPNNQALWQRLKRTISAFLTQQWRDGALFGAKVEEAFYVRIDEALNPDNERALGRLYIEIGVRPSYPAEFIIVRIGIWQGGGDVSEA